MFKNHPKGLIPAALSNMGERFGYYIMAAVLSLFLCSKFGLADDKAALIYSIFLAAIYILSLVGGIIADRTQNYKGTIMTGIIIMALGYAALAICFIVVTLGVAYCGYANKYMKWAPYVMLLPFLWLLIAAHGHIGAGAWIYLILTIAEIVLVLKPNLLDGMCGKKE